MTAHDHVAVTVIGAGVVGLSIARELAGRCHDVLVVEKNESFGRETSSRHSGVIHAGIYYPAGSLKARFCTEGNGLIHEYCRTRDIPHRNTGKLIVAVDEHEGGRLRNLKAQGDENGVPGLAFLSGRELHGLEPDVSAREALFSPSTGIIDAHALMRSYLVEAESRGAEIVFYSCITAIRFDGRDYELEINGTYRFRSRAIVNCAGLYSDAVAALAGIDVEREGYRLRFCKGTYFAASPAPRINHLVYPVPGEEDVGLGIHATLDLGGRVRFGPDAEYVSELSYDSDEGKRDAFHRAVSRYLPGVKREHLHSDTTGIRPKLQGPGEPFRDFVISEERGRGLPGFINLIGIDSPGLTSSPAIAAHVAALVKEVL
jgi:L-2-hydroxyglutarate oxidase LhgO